MTNMPLSKKQTIIAKKRRLCKLREEKKSRAKARSGHASGYKPNTLSYFGYTHKSRQLPWKGGVNKSGSIRPYGGEGMNQSSKLFFLHPINYTPHWDTSIVPTPVTQYYYESVALHASLPPAIHPSL
jgi:hypothetical protein